MLRPSRLSALFGFVFSAASLFADDGQKILRLDHYVRVKSAVPAISGQMSAIYVREVVRAGNLRTLWYIVWPGCRGTTVSLAMLGFIGALKTFDIPYLVTTGGPYHSTEFLGTYIYRMGIRQAHIGYAAAISIVLLVLAVAGALVIGRANRKGASA